MPGTVISTAAPLGRGFPLIIGIAATYIIDMRALFVFFFAERVIILSRVCAFQLRHVLVCHIVIVFITIITIWSKFLNIGIYFFGNEGCDLGKISNFFLHVRTIFLQAAGCDIRALRFLKRREKFQHTSTYLWLSDFCEKVLRFYKLFQVI